MSYETADVRKKTIKRWIEDDPDMYKTMIQKIVKDTYKTSKKSYLPKKIGKIIQMVVVIPVVIYLAYHVVTSGLLNLL